jgi:hypothetical protein
VTGGPRIAHRPIAARASFTALVCAGPGAGATKAAVYFTNLTTGAYTSVFFAAPAPTTLVGNDAEWIVEAPELDGVQTEMADYDEVTQFPDHPPHRQPQLMVVHDRPEQTRRALEEMPTGA